MISRAFQTDILELLGQPSIELEILKKHWKELDDSIRKGREEARNKIPADDPIRLHLDLLTPLDCISDEIIHTRALAYLLRPTQSHGLSAANGVLAEILTRLPAETCATEILAILRGDQARVEVTPEYRYSIEGFGERSLARCDMWIEIHSKSDAALIIIENKIGSLEHGDQTKWYKNEAKNWRNKYKYKKGRSILIWLAPDERGAGDNWISLRYIALASALRAVWCRNECSPDFRAWLGFYIASITQGILGMDVGSADLSINDINLYLGEARS